MKLQHLSASLLLVLIAAPLACGGTDDDVMLGNDHAGESSSAGKGGTKSGGGASSAGSASGGSATNGGSQSGGTSSGGTTSTGGSASAGTSTGGAAGSGPYEPCAGKACGEVCTICDPNGAPCAPAIGIAATCTAFGTCSVGKPNCTTTPTCEDNQQYFSPGCADAKARPSDPAIYPLVAGCYDTCSTASPCADGYVCRTVWHDPSVACKPSGAACPDVCGGTIDLCVEG